MAIIVALKLWGHKWSGKRVQIFCDNDSVCDVITSMKPKDPDMQKYLREFLYFVCKFNFCPVVSKIGTKENDFADFLSRNFWKNDAEAFFMKSNLPSLIYRDITDDLFDFVADW